MKIDWLAIVVMLVAVAILAAISLLGLVPPHHRGVYQVHIVNRHSTHEARPSDSTA